MYPYLLENWIGHSVLIPTYGVVLVLAYTAGYIEALRRALLLGEKPKHIERIFLIVILGSLFGARLFHIAFEEFAYYWENPKQVVVLWEGGFTFFGGLAVSLGLITAYCRYQNLSLTGILDCLTPSVPLGLFIGRIGCFTAGCCWGRTTSLPWGVTFSNIHGLSGIRHVPVHPVQLYESFGSLVLFIYLLRLFKRKPKAGTVFLHGMAGYACLRFLVEFFRGDEIRGFVFGGWLSLGQFFSAAVLLLCAIAFYRMARRGGIQSGV